MSIWIDLLFVQEYCSLGMREISCFTSSGMTESKENDVIG